MKVIPETTIQTISCYMLYNQCKSCTIYRYGGILYGITNTIATIPGMLSPIAAADLTPHVRYQMSYTFGTLYNFIFHNWLVPMTT